MTKLTAILLLFFAMHWEGMAQENKLHIFKWTYKEVVSCDKACEKSCMKIALKENVFNVKKTKDTLSLKFNLWDYDGFTKLNVRYKGDTVFFSLSSFFSYSLCGDNLNVIECKIHYPFQNKPKAYIAYIDSFSKKKQLPINSVWVDCF